MGNVTEERNRCHKLQAKINRMLQANEQWQWEHDLKRGAANNDSILRFQKLLNSPNQHIRDMAQSGVDRNVKDNLELAAKYGKLMDFLIVE